MGKSKGFGAVAAAKVPELLRDFVEGLVPCQTLPLSAALAALALERVS